MLDVRGTIDDELVKRGLGHFLETLASMARRLCVKVGVGRGQWYVR